VLPFQKVNKVVCVVEHLAVHGVTQCMELRLENDFSIFASLILTFDLDRNVAERHRDRREIIWSFLELNWTICNGVRAENTISAFSRP